MSTTTSQTSHRTADETTPVLIVGGSLVGLSTSLFLGRQGIRSLLVERHPGTSVHPRVASLTARTLEIFRSVGAESAIRQIEPPFSLDSKVPLVESLLGEEVDNLQEDMSAYFTDASPVRGSLIAQDVLETALPTLAKQAGGELRYQSELIDFEQDEGGIIATIRDLSNGTDRMVRAHYLVAADGGRSSIRQQLGIGQQGIGSLGHFISMIFETDANLLEEFRKRQAVMCFVANDLVSGGFVPYAGSSVRPNLFRVDVGYDPDEESLADYPEARCLPIIRAAIGDPNYPVRFKTVGSYEMAQRVADRFQQGRAFLVGDAARVQPPAGALGGNMGIAEAHNLAWKLAAVLRSEANPRLLATYNAERQPLAVYTSEKAAQLSQERQTEGSEGITVNTLMLNMGYRYGAGAAIVPEIGAEQLPQFQDPHQWTGEPGTRAPHIVLQRQGTPLSTLDLFGSHFVLLVGLDGHNWLDAARSAKTALHLPLDIYQIGSNATELTNPDQTFCRAYGITSSGAAVVRPDGFIGWRSQTMQAGTEPALTQALLAILSR